MATRNGSGKPPIDKALHNLGTPRTETLLDVVLRDEPASYQAKVRELVMKSGIHPDEDQLMLLVAAIGYLRVLIQEAPDQWRELFSNFETELDQWATNNVEHLKQLAGQTETISTLAQSCERLGITLESLQTTCELLIEQFKTYPQLSTALNDTTDQMSQFTERILQFEARMSQLQSSLNKTNDKLPSWEQMREKLSQLREMNRSIENIQQELEIRKTSWSERFAGLITAPERGMTWRGNLVVISLGLICAVPLLNALAIWGVSLTQQGYARELATTTEQLRQVKQQNQWLLEKMNRTDCRDGLLSASNPICQQLQK